jgi:hypothetical protein
MLKSAIAASAAIVALTTLGIDAKAASPGFCAEYARSAVAQFYANQRIPGCFQGANLRWHPNYDQHYGWCLGASYGAAEHERGLRHETLEFCRARAR